MDIASTSNNCTIETGIMNKQENEVKRTAIDAMILIAFIGIIAMIILYIYYFIRSTRYKQRTKTPKTPNWMDGIPTTQRILISNGIFSIATKNYAIQTEKRSGKHVESSKPVIYKMRRILQKIFGITIDTQLLPDATCVISIPKLNFRSGTRHGEFIPLHGGLPSISHFEYQMYGDDRIQVTYYVVGGVSYVAGLCVYIGNPYQNSVHYRENIIKELLNKPDYWSKYQLKEETMNIVKRRTDKEHILITKNRYGDIKHRKLNSDQKCFKSMEVLHSSAYISPETENSKIISKSLKVQICKFHNNIVMISERNGIKMHAVLNKKTEKIEYFKCNICNEPDDAPPPSYLSVINK